jgi:hypothetical protein
MCLKTATFYPVLSLIGSQMAASNLPLESTPILI